MDNNIQKYQIMQSGKTYILTSEIKDDFLRLTFVEVNVNKPQVFIGDYDLDYLRQLNPLFNSVSTIQQAQNIINNTIEDQKLKVENKIDSIYIYLYIANQGQSQAQINPLVLKPQYEITYSPVRYLPVRKVYLPEVKIKRPTIYIQENNDSQQNIPYSTQSGKTEKLTLTLTPKKRLKNAVQSPILVNTSPEIPLFGSPKREQIDIIASSPTKTHTQIIRNVGSSTSNNNNNFGANQKLVFPVETTTSYINNDERIVQLQNEIIQLKTQNNILKNQYDKSIEQITKLNNEILRLKKENEDLRQNIIGITNKTELNEINMLKKEIERLNNEIENLQNEKKKDLEEYKQMQEQEINSYLKQMKELTDIANSLRLENDNLKSKLHELINNYNLLQSQISKDGNLAIVRGEIIQSKEELELLIRKISTYHKTIKLTLLYKATVDSDKAETFHKKCDKAECSIVLVKSTNGKRFGGYTSCNWMGENIDKKDDNAFVFSLDKMKIYDIIKGENAIGCYHKYGPVFLGCQIRIYDDFFERGGTTFQKGLNYATEEDYELTGGIREFQIEEVEVYAVELE